MISDYEIELCCDNCDRETTHKVTGEVYERDSRETFTCTECNWYCNGIGNEYYPPIELDEDENYYLDGSSFD